MLLGIMPEDSVPEGLLVPTAKSQRATDFSIAAIMARGASPPDSDSVRDPQSDGGLSRLSSPDLDEHLEDDDVEVDVEECSDSESTRIIKPKLSRQSPPISDCGSEIADIDRDSPDIIPEKTPPKTPKILCNCEELLNVECHLETKDLWDKFHDLGTEMIITKTGRVYYIPKHPLSQVTCREREGNNIARATTRRG